MRITSRQLRQLMREDKKSLDKLKTDGKITGTDHADARWSSLGQTTNHHPELPPSFRSAQ